MLINKKAVKLFALECGADRAHKFTRVSKDFYETIDARVKHEIREAVKRLPSVGKTIK